MERESQKAIVIGREGQVIEKIRKSAREKLMAMTDTFVDLKLRSKSGEGLAEQEAVPGGE